jgi:hypothetical protein
MHQLGENDSYHLWILNKMAQNHNKFVVTAKQKCELLEKFENTESVTELAISDYVHEMTLPGSLSQNFCQ